MGMFFLLFVAQTHAEWQINPQYSYGWGVPILGAVLFWNRWKTCPPAAPVAPRFWMLAGGALILCAWLPLRIVREANMDWRMVQWMIASICLGGMFAVLAWSGGRPWVRHFAVPIGFLLAAVPWPTRLEAGLVQGSTEAVVRATVEALRWLGIAAWSAGNVVQLPNTAVGVDEACSGLRSFQGALMCSLFLGELKRLNWKRRIILLTAGAVIAVGLNFLRTLVLAWLAAKGGDAKLEAWHDRTGLGTLVASFVLLWIFAAWLGRKSKPLDAAPSFAGARPLPWMAAGCCALWFGLAELSTWAWFRQGTHPPATVWEILPSAVGGEFQQDKIPERIKAILKFDRATAFRRTAEDGTEWRVFSIRWSSQGGGAPLARFHSPEVCLPAAGLKLLERGTLLHPVGEDLPFRWHRFDWKGRPVYVYHAFYSSTGTGSIQSMDEFDLTWPKRLRLAWRGERPAEQKVFQILISGAASERAAREAFEAFARSALRKAAIQS